MKFQNIYFNKICGAEAAMAATLGPAKARARVPKDQKVLHPAAAAGLVVRVATGPMEVAGVRLGHVKWQITKGS